MMNLKWKFFLILLMMAGMLYAQKRFRDEVILKVDSLVNIRYGEAVDIRGNKEPLLLDIYSPSLSDSMKYRPLVIFIHGGGFRSGSKADAFAAMVCRGFARRGYVAASIDYRLGVEQSGIQNGKPVSIQKDYWEAMYRGQQDGRAAVRFFRRYFEKYGIDTSRIFIAGSAAGSMICLSMAYMDEDEVPTDINRGKWGSAEGSSGHEGFSSGVGAVINARGAMIDYRWIQAGEEPLFNTSGLLDKTVPSDSNFDYHGFRYGGHVLFQHCLELGIPSGWKPFQNTGQVLDNNTYYQHVSFRSMSDWLYSRLNYEVPVSGMAGGVFRLEKEMEAFDEQNRVSRYASGTYLFIGGSRIRLWNTLSDDLSNTRAVNRGFGSCNLSDVAYYIDRIISPFDPKAIFLYVCDDITGRESDGSPDQVLELYKYVVKRIRLKFPGVPVVWLALFPGEHPREARGRIRQANRLIRDYSRAGQKLYFLDCEKRFSAKDGKVLSAYFKDGSWRFSPKGYLLWAKSIRKVMEQIAGE